MKQNQIAFGLFLVIVLMWGGQFFIKAKNTENLMKFLLKHGVRKEAAVLEKEQLLPLKSLSDDKNVKNIILDFDKKRNEYGQITYEYSDLKGRGIKAFDYVSKEVFDAATVGGKINILYHPDRTEISRIKDDLIEEMENDSQKKKKKGSRLFNKKVKKIGSSLDI